MDQLNNWIFLSAVFTVGLSIAALATRLAYSCSEKIAEAPLLDIFISIFTWIPWAVGFFIAGWIGLAAAVTAQFCLLHLFCITHRICHKRWGKNKGVTLTDTQNRIIGALPNQLALLAQTPAVLTFVTIRAAELTVYPILAHLAHLPRYKHSEWVNLSRHKHVGLVGYDLLWCWYCDWMTGLWALGSEMLRNIESFWCPIRFQSDTKNRNSSLDFPDVEKWAPTDSSMADVAKLIEEHYPGKNSNSWWGHPDRKNPQQD